MHHHHNPLDILTVPILTGSVLTWPIWSWTDWLWSHIPTPTAAYMGVSFLFMLFQMGDKLGLLDRFKRRRDVEELKEDLAELELEARQLQNKNLADVAHGAVARVEQVLTHPDFDLVKMNPQIRKETKT